MSNEEWEGDNKCDENRKQKILKMETDEGTQTQLI